MSYIDGLRHQARRSGMPGTYALIALLVGSFVLSWILNGALFQPLQFFTNFSQPWGLITYPFASTGNGLELFWFLLLMYWFWWVGGSAEVELGTTKYVIFFFAAAVVAALSLTIGAMLISPGKALPILGGAGLTISALTVAWGTRHRAEVVRLMMVIPVPGYILALLTVALTLFGYGSMYGAPLMGAFACVHLGLAYLFATNRLGKLTYSRGASISEAKARKKSEAMSKEYYDDVRRREQEREERERLRKLFESSMNDGDKPDK